MTRKLDPAFVARGLQWLSDHFVAETVEEGRARLLRDAQSPDVFPGAVARRLEELRALDDLARVITGVAKQRR